MKLVTLVGARPQFVKCAVVSLALRQVAQELLVHTGQHYDDALSDRFFRDLGIPAPDYRLQVGSGLHGAQTGVMLNRIEEVLQHERPDGVLVYGDTNTTLAGALAAAKLEIPVAHIEAGLRSFNRSMPEELNRIVTDHLACLHFCPTEQAVTNLRREGILSGIQRVGDVMYDAIIHFRQQAEASSQILQSLNLPRKGYLLVTIHRAENTNDLALLQSLFVALGEAARLIPTVIPLHPRTRASLEKLPCWRTLSEPLILLEPVGYLDMLKLEANARWIATDSGGVQKEAFFCGVPCVTLRNETEWTELIDFGWNRLLPPVQLKHQPLGLVDLLPSLDRGRCDVAPYGPPGAVQRIVDRLQRPWQAALRAAA